MSCHRELPVLCCCCSVPKLNPTLCDPVDCSTLGSPVLHCLLLKLNVHRVGDTIQPSHPLSSPHLLSSVFPSFQVFSKETVLLIRWPRYRSFGFSISPSNEYSRLISLGWTGLISLQFKGLAQESFLALQFESINALALSFMIQLSHLYTTTEKAIALTVWIFAGKVMSLLFNTLSRLVIAFLSRSKHLWFCGCSHRPQWFWSPRK